MRCRGRRKYLTSSERQRLEEGAGDLKPRDSLLILLLLWTGARISEILDLRASSIDLAEGLVALNTLKRRQVHVRELPLPPHVLDRLECIFSLSRRQMDPDLLDARLFGISRSAAWRIVKALCLRLQISGPAASPKGIRHSFGVSSLQSGVPITLVQRWLGHARLTTTAIYTSVTGPEERAFAQKFWTFAVAPPE